MQSMSPSGKTGRTALLTWMRSGLTKETCEHLHYPDELWCTQMTSSTDLSSLKWQQGSWADMRVWTIEKYVTWHEPQEFWAFFDKGWGGAGCWYNRYSQLVYIIDLLYIKARCLTIFSATPFAYSSQRCFMYDWFDLFVCTVTEEPHQSQFAVWHNKRYTHKFFFWSKKTICTRLLLLPTSFIIFAIWAERFGRYVASQPSPSWLADAVPDVLIQDAPSVVITQPGAAVCQHIMYVSHSRASQKKKIRSRKWGLGRRQERREGI